MATSNTGTKCYKCREEATMHICTKCSKHYEELKLLLLKMKDQEKLVEQILNDQINNQSLIQNQNNSSQYIQTIIAKKRDFLIMIKRKWEQYATTIAGGNQLNTPDGIYVDDQEQTIYVANCNNHSIVKWKFGERNGEVVAGGNEKGNRIDQLNYPCSVILDQNKKSLIICDVGNRRVVRWSLENQNDRQILIEDIACAGLMMNSKGDLFVSDWKRGEVKKWKKGEKQGIVVAGENGNGDKLNQLNYPGHIFVDREDSIYVLDRNNHRVMKWLKGAKEGIVVAGGQGYGNSFKQLSDPQGLVVNENGDVFVADYYNDRVMCWPTGSKEGRVVVGGNGEGEGSNQLRCPRGLVFDRANNLYVVDSDNHRIQRFNVDKN